MTSRQNWRAFINPGLMSSQGGWQPQFQQTCQFFNGRHWDPFSDLHTAVREMERNSRGMENAFNRLGNMLPSFSRAIPVQSTGLGGNMHRISLDMSGFKPEDVNVSLKNRQVIIDAKMEEKSDDGHHRMYQEVTRQYTLPENVQVEKLRSLLSDDGVLSIEAPIAAKDGHPGPIEIPIQCDSKGGKGQ